MSIQILHERFSSRLQIVFKISERCNLACSYCYFFFRGDETYKEHPPIVPTDVITALIEFMTDAHTTHHVERIDIVLHGGEPLLMKKQKFDEMITRIRADTPETLKVAFGLQTNAALIDDEWIDLFETHVIGVGVSMDGPKEVHDEFRLDQKGRGSYDDCRAGWEILQAAAKKSRIPKPGLLAVVLHERNATEIYEHFVRDLGATSIDFLLPDLHHDDKIDEAQVEGTAEYLLDVFHAWIDGKDERIGVRFINEVYGAMLSDIVMDESVSYKDDYRCVLTVASNGEIRSEDTICTIDDRFRDRSLNVKTSTLSDVIESEWWKELNAAYEKRPERCDSCSWWSVCKSGKPYNRFSAENSFDNHSVFCDALQTFYVEVAAYLTKIGYSLDEIVTRLERGNLGTQLPPPSPVKQSSSVVSEVVQ